MLSPGRGLRRAAAEALMRQPDSTGWKVIATLHSLDQIHEVETQLQGGDSARQVRIDEKTAPQTALGRIARILWLVPAMDRLWVEGAGERRRFLDRMTLSLEPNHAEATVAYEKAMRERNRLLKDQVDDPSWFSGLEAQMAEHGARIIANRHQTLDRLRQAQSDASTSFPTALLEITGPEGAEILDATALKDALSNGRYRDMAAGRTLSGPHRADLTALYAAKGMEARHCSTGEQKALLVSLVLANARAVAQDFGAPPILLLDEVAAHLDADRRAALYDEIVDLQAQAWMTGTGSDLFAALGTRAQWISVTETDGLSQVVATSPQPPAH